MSSCADAMSVLIDASSLCEVGCSSPRWTSGRLLYAALVDQRQHLLAGLPVLLVDGPDVLVERGVVRLGLLQLVQPLGEGRFGVLDLPVVLGGIVRQQQCHRPVVALGRHRVEHLLRPAGLHLRTIELLHAIVHLPDDEEAEHRHRHEQQGADEEAEEQLAVDACFHPSDRIDERAQPAGEARHLRFGGRHHLVTSHLEPPISACGDRKRSAPPILGLVSLPRRIRAITVGSLELPDLGNEDGVAGIVALRKLDSSAMSSAAVSGQHTRAVASEPGRNRDRADRPRPTPSRRRADLAGRARRSAHAGEGRHP